MSKSDKTCLVIEIEKIGEQIGMQCSYRTGGNEQLNHLADFVANDLSPAIMRSIKLYYQSQQRKELNHVTH